MHMWLAAFQRVTKNSWHSPFNDQWCTSNQLFSFVLQRMVNWEERFNHLPVEKHEFLSRDPRWVYLIHSTIILRNQVGEDFTYHGLWFVRLFSFVDKSWLDREKSYWVSKTNFKKTISFHYLFSRLFSARRIFKGPFTHAIFCAIFVALELAIKLQV